MTDTKVLPGASTPGTGAAGIRDVATVLQLGPGLTVRGGISSVERMLVEHCGPAIAVRHVATMEDGSLWRKLRVFVRAIREVRRALGGPQQLVVHIHFSSRGSTLRKVILARMTLHAGQPLVLHAHGSTFDEFFDRLPRFVQRAVQRTFARADCFVVLSSQWRDFYVTRCKLPESRVVVMCNPASLPGRVPERSGRQRVQFLFLGRIGRRKGAFDLLQAFGTLPLPLRRRARLVLAGDGEVETLREQARAFDADVEVHSWIDSRRRDELLAQSDVFVLPSYHEGVPMALLEAMAYGLPVVTTRVGGIPDAVTANVEGLLIEPGDHAQLAKALRTMIEDEELRATFGRNARLRAEAFDVKHYASNLARVYRRLLALQGSNRGVSDTCSPSAGT